MANYVYLIKNKDLYKIGSTSNLKQEMKHLKPDEIVESIVSLEAKNLEARLLKRYKNSRVPQTNYFRLTEEQISDCKLQLSTSSQIPKSFEDEIRIGINASIIAIFLSFLISIAFHNNFFKSLSVSIIAGSIPMWFIFIFGSFGGYDIVDLQMFSTWFNRLKSFLIAFSMSCVAYVTFKVSLFF